MVSKKKLLAGTAMLMSFVLFFRPRTLNLYSGLSDIYYIFQILMVYICVLLFVACIIKGKIKLFSALAYWMVLFQLIQVYSAYVNGLFDSSLIIRVVTLIASVMLSEYFLRTNPKIFISLLNCVCGLLVFLNNISFYWTAHTNFTDATGNLIYFWSTKNHLASLFFLTLITSILVNRIVKKRIVKAGAYFAIVNVFWGVLIFKSSTTIVGILAFTIALLLCRKKQVVYKPMAWFFLLLGLHVAIVVFRVQHIFTWLIEQILHKNLTLTGRTHIWNVAMALIQANPWLGYGKSSLLKFAFTKYAIPAHNQFLDIGITCGIPGLLVYLIILYCAFRNLSKCKESPSGRVMACALLAYLVMSIAESPDPYQPWFIIFAMTAYMKQLDSLYQRKTFRLVFKKRSIGVNE